MRDNLVKSILLIMFSLIITDIVLCISFFVIASQNKRIDELEKQAEEFKVIYKEIYQYGYDGE